MKKSWWRAKGDLDNERRLFVESGAVDKTALIGPPGSGKTNLLLLRAELLALRGEPDVLFVTYTKTLAKFIRTGVRLKGHISPNKIKTYHSWALGYIFDQTGEWLFPSGHDFNERDRAICVERLRSVNDSLSSKKMYGAIFVDEAQDLTIEELQCLLCLSDRVCIAGDVNQSIYYKNGMRIVDEMGLSAYELRKHFRIGHKIARIADRLIPPDNGKASIESTSNYDAKEQGDSSATFHRLVDRTHQFEEMLKLIRIQLVAFKDETIGIICGLRETCSDLRHRFDKTDLAALVCVHGVDVDPEFDESKLIHVITIYSSKGTEFKCVHMYGVEELVAPFLRRTNLSYTAVTRAKTALNVYCTGETTAKIESAFAEKTMAGLDDLFSD